MHPDGQKVISSLATPVEYEVPCLKTMDIAGDKNINIQDNVAYDKMLAPGHATYEQVNML